MKHSNETKFKEKNDFLACCSVIAEKYAHSESRERSHLMQRLSEGVVASKNADTIRVLFEELSLELNSEKPFSEHADDQRGGELLFKRLQTTLTVYLEAFNRLKSAVSRFDDLVGPGTVMYNKAPELTAENIEKEKSRFLSESVSLIEFENRIAVEEEEIKVFSTNLAATFEGFEGLLRSAYFLIAKRFDPAVQRDLLRKQLKWFQRLVPFYVTFRVRSQIRKNLLPSEFDATFPLIKLFQQGSLDARKRARNTGK